MAKEWILNSAMNRFQLGKITILATLEPNNSLMKAVKSYTIE